MRDVSSQLHEFGSKEEMMEFADEVLYGIDEASLRGAMERYLSKNQFMVFQGRVGHNGPDIQASKQGRKLIIEAKGECSSQSDRRHSFEQAIAQIVSRMESEGCDYAIALPAHYDFCRLICKLPNYARKILHLNFYLVDVVTLSDEYVISYLSPDVS